MADPQLKIEIVESKNCKTSPESCVRTNHSQTYPDPRVGQNECQAFHASTAPCDVSSEQCDPRHNFNDIRTGNSEQCEPLQSITDPDNQMHTKPNRTEFMEGSVCHVTRGESQLQERVCHVEKENEENPTKDRDTSTSDDLTNKIQVVFNLDGLKEVGGLLYIGCKDDICKTNPTKIAEWFTAEFLNLHRIYAIKEEEPFFLRVFTRNHETINRGIRKKGGRKVMLMGQEVFGDVLLACGRCGYWSHEGSNVRRHLKKAVCLKERDYCKEDVAGLDRIERNKFLRRLSAAKSRAKKKARVITEGSGDDQNLENSEPRLSNTSLNAPTNYPLYPALSLSASSEGRVAEYAECLVEIQETPSCVGHLSHQGLEPPVTCVPRISDNRLLKPKRRPPKALTLGPALTSEAVQHVSYDIFTVSEKNERVAWKPPTCHKANTQEPIPCQIVFRGARMKRRCMDLPVPKVLVYRKLECKTHHCNFTLFHPSARQAFTSDPTARASVNIKMYNDIVMTQEFYHYVVSLLSVMKMNSSQTARHLTSVWETILGERLGLTSVPDEYRKLLTLSKQTVKSIWASIEEEAGRKGGLRLLKSSRRKKKVPPAPSLHTPPVSALPPPPPPPPPSLAQMSHPGPMPCGGMSQACMTQHCMKRLNTHMAAKPPPLPPPTHPTHGPPKNTMMPPPPRSHAPPPPHHNPMPQVTHTHWLGQAGSQYPHNMPPYPMAPPPPHPPTAGTEYYHMPGHHFMSQYTPTTMGTSP